MMTHVVLQYAGQMMDMGYVGLTAGQGAKVIGVSKVTAMKKLRFLCEKGLLVERTRKWRGDAVIKYFELTDKALKMYKKDVFKPAYMHYIGTPDDSPDQLKLF